MSLPRGTARLVLAAGLLVTLGASATTPPEPARVADRAYQAGLLAEAQRVRDAVALALRAPRMAYPILVPTEPGAFVLGGATVEEDGEEVYHALRYRRPDGACFTVSGSDGRTWRLVSAGERFRCPASAGPRSWSPQPCE